MSRGERVHKQTTQPLTLLPERNVRHEKRLVRIACRVEIWRPEWVEADNVPDYHILPLEARNQFHGSLPAKASMEFNAPTRPWMRLACGKLLGVTVELPYSFCSQIRTMVRATIHKGEWLDDFAFLSKTNDLEQPHVDNIRNGNQIE